MGDSGGAAVDGDFSELEDDGGGWCEDVLAEDSHRENRAIAFFEIEQLWDAGGIEARDRDPVRHGDFVGVWREDDIAAGPDDNRRYPEARAGWVVVEKPKYAIGRAGQAHLFVELTQCSACRIFAFVDAAPGKGPLPTMVPKARHAAGDDETSIPRFVGDDRHGNRGGAKRRVGLGRAFVGGEVCVDSCAQGLVGPKTHELDILPIRAARTRLAPRRRS